MGTKTEARKTRALERSRKAWELRLAGHSITQIARTLGVSIGQASMDVSRAFAEYREQMAKEAAEVARLDLARLDEILKALWPAVQQGDTKAVAQAINVLGRRARILGYEAATKQEVTVTNDTPDLDALKKMLEQELNGGPTSTPPSA